MTKRHRKPGRPRISRDGDLLRPRTVRFSDAEWEWIEAQAESKVMSAARWLRALALRGFRPRPTAK